MPSKPKIVIIGAGSVIFGLSMIKDAFTYKELWGSDLILVDIDKDAVKRIATAAEKLNQVLGAQYKISYTDNRKDALIDADFVISSIAIDRVKLWKQDFHIPKKYGIEHVLGENVGPGALFHTMRNIPILLDICKDIETYCPNAWLINFTNPESRICLAIQKFTDVKVIGLCHQIKEGIRNISTILNKQPLEIDVKAWGLNHFSWMFDIRERNTGENLYPQLIEKEKTFDTEFEPLSRFIFKRFGYFPTAGDDHLGEFFPFAHEMMSSEGYDFEKYERRRQKVSDLINDIIHQRVKYDDQLIHPSGEKAFEIMKSIMFNKQSYIESANILNRGYIKNLPNDAIVEVPSFINENGVEGEELGNLPRGIAALCTAQIHVQHLAVDAGVKGDKDLALEALLIDPNVPSAKAALRLFDELMEVNRPYLPQF